MRSTMCSPAGNISRAARRALGVIEMISCWWNLATRVLVSSLTYSCIHGYDGGMESVLIQYLRTEQRKGENVLRTEGFAYPSFQRYSFPSGPVKILWLLEVRTKLELVVWIRNTVTPCKIQQRYLLPEELVDTLRDATKDDDRREDGMVFHLPYSFKLVLHICKGFI